MLFPPPAVYFYRAYGQILASDLSFPELRPAEPGPATWTVHDGGVAARSADATGVVLGSEPLYGGFTATLRETADGWRIVVDDTGEFDLGSDGRITARRYPEGSLDFLRAHLLGRVIAAGLHRDGDLVLHGSAVSYPSEAIAFLAPKGTGKSTLALKLTMAGARLMSDDTLPVRMIDEQPMVSPGVHSMRLRGDSAQELTGRLPEAQRPDGKYVVGDIPEDRLEQSRRPLGAIYLLVAAERIAEGGPIARRQLAVPAAAAALVGMSKIPRMLGQSQGPELLRRAVGVASKIPVYQLMIQRDLQALPDVAARIATWHGAAAG